MVWLKRINSKTNRVVKPEDTGKNGEFTYRDGSPVKEGTSYHIHYTDDLNEYYMTESIMTKIRNSYITN